MLRAQAVTGSFEIGRTVVEPSDLIFSHDYHVLEEELECVDCHSVAEESVTGLDNLIPDHDVCADCHDPEDPDECASCHANPDEAPRLLRVDTYSEKFSHETHLSAELECATCHVQTVSGDAVEPMVYPAMLTCLDCHEDRSVATTCDTCHLETDDLTPPSHGIDFEKIHGDLARFDANAIDGLKSCQTCHQDDFCQDCHETENVDLRTHPLNFEFTHALEAQSFELTCQSCHEDVQFCADCHAANLVMPHTHTPGWANSVDGGRHRLEALNDLQTCISCHVDDAETVCGSCHIDSL